MKEYAKRFYKSPAWKNCRDGYAKSVGGLCERCLSRGQYVPGVIVHHKNPLTPDNIDNPSVALDWRNLQLLCRDCHAEIHRQKERRYRVDDMGRIIW